MKFLWNQASSAPEWVQLHLKPRKEEAMARLLFALWGILMIGFGGRSSCWAADGSLPPEEQSLAVQLVDQLDLNRPGMEGIEAAASRGDYRTVLNLYRDRVVQRLRDLDLGSMKREPMLRPFMFGEAQMLTGRWSAEQFEAEVGNRRRHWAPYKASETQELAAAGLMAPPGTPVDWRAAGGIGRVTVHGLVSAYWLTHDPVYRDRWFEIMGQYSRAFWKAEGQAEFGSGVVDFQPLARAFMVPVYIQSLGVFAKDLDTDTKPRWQGGLAKQLTSLPSGVVEEWNQVLQPCSKPVTPEQMAAIPAAPMAAIALSLVNDHPKLLIDMFIRGGYFLPNQNMAGIRLVAMTAIVFDDFKVSREIAQAANDGFVLWARKACHPDGGMLEQDFHYNLFALEDMRDVLSLVTLNGIAAPWIADYRQRIEKFERLLAAVRTPRGTLPMIGNFEYVPVKPLQSSFPSATVGFQESVCFPYSGYAVMRTPGGPADQLYLMFSNSRRSAGHCSNNTGSIHITAYGRDLIVPGGAPSYSMTVKEQKSEETQFDRYFGEHSTFKNSTAIVNYLPQASFDHCVLKKDWLAAASTVPVQARWISSPAFDFSESRWAGYARRKDIHSIWSENLEEVADVEHHRQVFFVKAAGLWVVSDAMRYSPAPSVAKQAVSEADLRFTQIWNLAPPGDSATPLYGFTNEQVTVDEAQHVVRTNDPAGVNLFLQHFCGRSLRYEKFYGHRDDTQYLGWFSRNVGTFKTPRVDVHATWEQTREEFVSETTYPLVTIVAADRGLDPIVRSASPRLAHGGRMAGCEFTTASGVTVTFLTCDQPTDLVAGDVKVKAKTMLVVADPAEPGVRRGVLLNCETAQVAGNPVGGLPTDCEFEIRGGAMQPAATITIGGLPAAEGAIPEPSSR